MSGDFELFDSHFHIIDPRFPLLENRGYLPQSYTVADYRARTEAYRLCGGAVVSGSFQGFDQSYLESALRQLGPGFVGVTQLPHGTADAEIERLHGLGVRAVRFNLRRGGSESVRHLTSMAQRIDAVAGWHVELYVDATTLVELRDVLSTLPAVSIDHLGLSGAGLATLLSLAEGGVRVKACGFGRVDFDVRQALAELYAANPECLMFGTDLPCTRAPRPYSDDDFALVIDTLGAAAARRVFSENALAFYRP